MQALVFDGTLHVDERPEPVPAPGEALIRVLLAGICSTDIEICRGYSSYTGILGHEFVGRVISDDPARDRRRVCGEINLICEECSECRAGRGNYCLNRSVLGIVGRDGAFAPYLTLPLRNLHEVPDSVSDEEAVFVEPLAAAFHILEAVTVEPDDRVAVLGDGRLGILCAAALATTGARPVLIGKHPEKMNVARRLGIETVPVDEVPSEARMDLVVEATGSATGLEKAIALTRPRGTLVLKSTVADRHTVNLAPVVVNEISVIGSRCGPFDRAMRALSSGEVDVRPLISASYPLSEGIAAVDHATQGGLKVLLRP